MRTRTTFALVAIGTLLVPALAEASGRAVSPFATPVVLRGQEASTVLTFTLPQAVDKENSPVLELALRASDVVSKRLSSLSVELDDAPVASVPLERVASGNWEVGLGAMSSGNHVVRVVGRLTVDQDACLEHHEDDAWVTLLPATRLEMPAQHERSATGIPDLRSIWASGPTPSVLLSIPTLETEEDATLVLETAHFAHELGLGPVATGDVERELRIVRGADSAQLSTVQKGWFAVPSVVAVAELQDGTLTIAGRTDRDIGLAERRLLDASFESLCPRSGPCFVQPSDETSSAKPTVPERDPAVVLDLTDLGYSHGWAARGLGSHELRFVWTKPAWWKLSHSPELHFDVRLPDAGVGFDRSRSFVTVELNELPLATFALDRTTADSAELRVKIPEEHWSDPSWAVSINVVLKRSDDVPCTPSSGRSAWLRVGPDSGLVVQRDEARYEGIASFFESTTSRPDIVLDADWSLRQLLTLSTVIEPFAHRFPDKGWVATPEPISGHRFIRVEHAKSGDGLDGVAVGDGQFWADAARTLGVPLLDSRRSVRLSCAEGAPLGLDVFVSSGADDVSAPTYSTLLGRHAVVLDDAWRSFGIAEKPAAVVNVGKKPTPEESKAERLRSDQERLARMVNLSWASAVATFVLGAWWWAKRRPSSTNFAGRSVETGVTDRGKP